MRAPPHFPVMPYFIKSQPHCSFILLICHIADIKLCMPCLPICSDLIYGPRPFRSHKSCTPPVILRDVAKDSRRLLNLCSCSKLHAAGATHLQGLVRRRSVDLHQCVIGLYAKERGQRVDPSLELVGVRVDIGLCNMHSQVFTNTMYDIGHAQTRRMDFGTSMAHGPLAQQVLNSGLIDTLCISMLTSPHAGVDMS